MAKEEYSPEQIVAIEDDLHAISGKLKEIRKLLADAGEETVSLDLGTVLFYTQWLKGWAMKNRGAVEAAIGVKKKRRELLDKRKKSE